MGHLHFAWWKKTQNRRRIAIVIDVQIENEPWREYFFLLSGLPLVGLGHWQSEP
jgi:hypothetical protein